MSNELFEYIDNSLRNLKEADLMTIPHSNMPIEMIDKNVLQKSDWIPWKAIASKVTNDDLTYLESKINLEYPELYKEFLKYKHFYDLENINEITFFKHCVRDWKNDLLEYYFEYWEPDEIIKKGFIPFANYSDWGVVCFDTNRMVNRDCPIVMFDHETLYNEEVYYEELYTDFETMIIDLLTILKNN